MAMTDTGSQEGEMIRVAGMEFFVQRLGVHPDTVFVHGFGSDLYTWDLLWGELPATMSRLRYDLRGFGRTPEPGQEPFSHSDDLLALLDAMGIERCNLVGLSMGGSIALHLALDHPQRVKRLALISPSLMAWDWSTAWRERWRAIVSCARAGDMDEARRLWWQHPLFDPTRASDAAPLLKQGMERFAGRQWVQDNSGSVLPEIERLHSLEVPTLLLTGKLDLPDFRLIAEVIAASVPVVERVDFAGAGHLLHMEAPADCAREIVKFLES